MQRAALLKFSFFLYPYTRYLFSIRLLQWAGHLLECGVIFPYARHLNLMIRLFNAIIFPVIMLTLSVWVDTSLAAETVPEQLMGRRSTFSFVYENDAFNNSDVHYTNGVRVSWIPASDHTPDWAVRFARAIPWFPVNGQVRHGYSVGQSMFTPNDIALENPPQDARPYAGWLYGSISLGVETGRQLDQLVLTIGVVGPVSLAEQAQHLMHQLVRAQEAQGWDHQLHNEPGLMLSWQRSWRALAVCPLGGRQFDLTPHIGITVGNVLSSVNSGLTLRYGANLPLDYGPPRIQPGLTGTSSFVPTSRIGWYLFAGAEGRAVARNIFLDGNSFRNSRSVDK